MFCDHCGRFACDVCCASFALVNDQVMGAPLDDTGEGTASRRRLGTVRDGGSRDGVAVPAVPTADPHVHMMRCLGCQ
eukprot:3686369-Prorocentrum_lima.AAC.1